jgi:hypothetical protein
MGSDPRRGGEGIFSVMTRSIPQFSRDALSCGENANASRSFYKHERGRKGWLTRTNRRTVFKQLCPEQKTPPLAREALPAYSDSKGT